MPSHRPALISVLSKTVTAITCWTALSSSVAADIYQYTDKNGTVCLTNDLANVPPPRRKSVKTIRETPKARAAAPIISNTPQLPEPARDPLPATAASNATATTRPVPWQKIISIALTVVTLLLVMRRLCRALSSPQLAKVIYVAFFLGTFVLGYKLYADHLVDGYFAIKQKMLTLFAKAQQREGLSQPRPQAEEKEP